MPINFKYLGISKILRKLKYEKQLAKSPVCGGYTAPAAAVAVRHGPAGPVWEGQSDNEHLWII